MPSSLASFGNSSVKIFCDLNRICEVEDAVVEWYEEAYYHRKGGLLDLTYLQDHFRLVEVLYAGVDGVICKAKLVALKPGLITRLGLPVVVKADVLCNEVKRIGYLKDREAPLQVRVGDTLILYVSTSTA